MKLLVALSAIIVPVVFAGASAADSAKPVAPSGFGQATAQNAQAGTTGGFVSGLAVNNPPGAVADDFESARQFLAATPKPPDGPKSDN